MSKKLSLFFIFLSLYCFLSTAYGENTIKILAIGNSFSQDAAESYVDDLAKADGVKVIIANMYIGGCSLETHWNNAKGDLAAYSYRKINDGDTTVIEKQKLSTVIQDEHWDYITFQQVSSLSGMFNSYFPFLPNLMAYVNKMTTNPNVKFALHQTWAYSSNSTHSGFANYNNSQQGMFEAIVSTASSVAKENNISIIVPAGTAIQNGRTSFIGDNFCRDGYHLNLKHGRYTASCTWYEKLLNKPVIGNKFVPEGMSAEEARVAQYAAHYAVLEPNIITSITNLLLTKNSAHQENPLVIAHRGASAYELENSLAAFSKAFELNADGFETDIWRTVDDSLVIMHDRNTGRTATGSLIVPESTMAQLRTLELKNGEKIPLLSEAIDILPAGKKIVIEIKCFNEKGKAGHVFPMLSDLLERTGRTNDAIIISFGADALAEAKAYLPNCKCYFLTGKSNAEEELIDICLRLKLDGLNVHHGIVTTSLAEKTKKAGLDLLVWTVDTPEQVQNTFGKVSGITTNKPDLIRELLYK